MKIITGDKRTVWLAAFGAAVANTVHQECKRGLNAVEAFDPESGGTLDVGSVADHAAAIADAAVSCIEWGDDRCYGAVGASTRIPADSQDDAQ